MVAVRAETTTRDRATAVRKVLGQATTRVTARTHTDTVGVADLADLGDATAKITKQATAVLKTVTSTAGCTAAVAEDRELRGAVAQAEWAVSALFGDQEGLFHTPTQPKTRASKTAVIPAMEDKRSL